MKTPAVAETEPLTVKYTGLVTDITPYTNNTNQLLVVFGAVGAPGNYTLTVQKPGSTDLSDQVSVFNNGASAGFISYLPKKMLILQNEQIVSSPTGVGFRALQCRTLSDAAVIL